MIYLLDTNSCIGYLNGRTLGVRQRLEALAPEDVVVCSVVKAELFYGAVRSRTPEQSLSPQAGHTRWLMQMAAVECIAAIFRLVRLGHISLADAEISAPGFAPTSCQTIGLSMSHHC